MTSDRFAFTDGPGENPLRWKLALITSVDAYLVISRVAVVKVTQEMMEPEPG